MAALIPNCFLYVFSHHRDFCRKSISAFQSSSIFIPCSGWPSSSLDRCFIYFTNPSAPPPYIHTTIVDFASIRWIWILLCSISRPFSTETLTSIRYILFSLLFSIILAFPLFSFSSFLEVETLRPLLVKLLFLLLFIFSCLFFFFQKNIMRFLTNEILCQNTIEINRSFNSNLREMVVDWLTPLWFSTP